MRVWAYAERIGVADLREESRPDPVAGPGQIVLRMEAAAINYRDLAIARGNYHVGVSAPLIPLSDGAGRVVEVGEGVTRFRVGDLACPNYMPDWIDGPVTPAKARRRLGGPSDGTLAELMAMSEEDAVRAPANLSAIEAATLPVAAVTAWHSLFEKASVSPGSNVLVTGSGGVSTSAIQLARAAGARVVAVTRRPERRGDLVALGASEVVVADGDWARQVGQLSQGGMDTIVDVVGGQSIAPLLSVLRPGGHMHLIGYASGTATGFDMFDAIRRAVTIHVGSGGSRASFEALNRAVEVNDIHPAIGATFPACDVPAAMEVLERGGTLGKLVVTFG